MPRRDTLTPRRGRASKLTPERADLIVNTVARGNHLATACGLAGVNTATLHRWIQRADALDHAEATGQPYDRADERYRDFRDRLLAARGQAAVRAVDVIDRAMQGGYLIEEEPATDGDGNPIYDEDGNLTYRRRYAQPDGRLALAFIAKSHPDQWGQNPTTRLEIVGGTSDDPAAEGPGADDVSRLAAKLHATVAARQVQEHERRELAAAEGETVDAELVEDDDG